MIAIGSFIFTIFMYLYAWFFGILFIIVYLVPVYLYNFIMHIWYSIKCKKLEKYYNTLQKLEDEVELQEVKDAIDIELGGIKNNIKKSILVYNSIISNYSIEMSKAVCMSKMVLLIH